LTRVIVSTDSEEIASAGRALGTEVPFLRPADLARDDTPMVDVVANLLRTLDSREGYVPDVVVLLQPTSPFRRGEHIDAAVDLLISSRADSVVTVVEVPHQFVSTFTLDGDRLSRAPAQDPAMPTLRQLKPRLFSRNGPAVVAVRPRVVLDQGTIYGTDMRALVMSREESIDIDDALDLEIAEMLLAREAGRSRA
jgi:CMP-N-acetylneuraminic acid synthetase